MPTYDYECDACQHAWELFQKITDNPVKTCPECKKRKARRLFGTGAAIMFKGSGFYETDYRSDSYKKAADKDKKASTESSSSDSKSDKKSKSESSSDSKGSSKSDTKSKSKKKD